jgi:TolB protein
LPTSPSLLKSDTKEIPMPSHPLLRRFLLIALLALTTSGAWAQVVVAKGKTTVALPPLTGSQGAASVKILEADLRRSGVVEVAAPEQADYIITGSAEIGALNGNLTDRRGGRPVITRTYSGELRHAAHEFADDIVRQITGVPGIASTQVAFIVRMGQIKELFVGDLDGANVRQVTRDNVLSGAPHFARDNQRIAYTSYKSGYPDVYTVNIQTGQRTRIAAFPGLNSGAAFSPDNSRVALTLSKDGNPEIYLIPATGGAATRITRTRGTEASPSWSPDGRQLVFTSDDRGSPQLYTSDLTGSAPQRLNTGVLYATEPDWSPDGKKIAFNARVAGLFQVYLYDVTSGQTQALTSGAADSEDPSWCRDSRHLVFARSGKLVLLDTLTQSSHDLDMGAGPATEPSCSP